MRLNTRKTILAGLFASLICVGAFLKVPLLFVPVTLQFFFVNFAVLFEERRYGVLSVAAYLLLGLCGLPVFAGGGGFSYILNPTFGYLIGFLLSAAVSGSLKARVAKTVPGHLLLSALNIFIVHLLGVLYYYFLSNFYLGSPIALSKLVVVGSLVFLPNDALCGALSSYLAVKMEGIVGARRAA